MPDSKLTFEELKAVLEALIYVSEEPLKEAEIFATLPGEEEATVRRSLEELILEYSALPRGIRIVRVAGGYRMQTRPEHDSWIRALYRQRNRVRLSRAALETLAIIAYRQPVTGPEIQSLRGTHPMGVLQTLLERRLIRTLGRKKVVGKPILYGTTDEFLVHFGLNSLTDLPSLEDFPGITPEEFPGVSTTETAGEMQEGLLSTGPEVRTESSASIESMEETSWDEERVLDTLQATPQADGRPHDEEE
jgi:segregation and condensation protein B